MSTATPRRPLPEITPTNEHYWTGGAAGELRFLRCTACHTYVHPPAPVCPRCLGRALVVAASSGRGVVATFTVNHQQWLPEFPPPYVVAIVELEDQPGLRVTTNVVGCAPEDVRIGLAVRATFEEHDGVWIPLFEPDR